HFAGERLHLGQRRRGHRHAEEHRPKPGQTTTGQGEQKAGPQTTERVDRRHGHLLELGQPPNWPQQLATNAFPWCTGNGADVPDSTKPLRFSFLSVRRSEPGLHDQLIART
ncbi:MAG: hypothetical protein ACK55I_40160, partial [bacterium]